MWSPSGVHYEWCDNLYPGLKTEKVLCQAQRADRVGSDGTVGWTHEPCEPIPIILLPDADESESLRETFLGEGRTDRSVFIARGYWKRG